MPVKAYQSKILVDQFDFSGSSMGWTINNEVKSLDHTVFQNAGQLRLPGLPMATIEHQGYVTTPAAGELEYELNALLGSTSTIRTAVIVDTSATIPVAFVLNSTFNQQL